MPIRITEIETGNKDLDFQTAASQRLSSSATDGPERIFKVEGSLHSKDAELLEKICCDVSDRSRRQVVIELSDICFLDPPSALVLCRMKREKGIEIRGLNLFIKKVMELADSAERDRYDPNIKTT